ncbi:site-specific recombinase XerC [Bradyrhizobium sp. RT6a]
MPQESQCSFGRVLEREGKGKVGALSAIRAPKVAKTLPKPLPMASAKRLADADERAGEDRETWILVRDAAVMALLYGSGLRISEALGLKRREVPKAGEGDVLVVTGKGNKTRMVPVLQNVLALIDEYVGMCPQNMSGCARIRCRRKDRSSSARAAVR